MSEWVGEIGWGWWLVLVGLFWAGCFLLFARAALRQRRTWVLTDAVVVKVRQRKSPRPDSGTYITATYRYVDRTGAEHIGHRSVFLRKPRKGSTLRVRYDPASPTSSEPARPLWVDVLVTVLGVGTGAVLVWLGLSGFLTS